MSPSASCDRWQARLVELVAGTLSEDERLGLVEHLDGCAACQALLERLEAGAGAMRAAEPPEMAPHLRQRQIALAMEHAARAPVRGGARWAWLLVPASAALLAIGVFGVQRAAPPVVLVAGGLEAGGRPVEPGASLRLDGELRLSATSDVQLALADGSRVRLAGASRAALARAGDGWRWRVEAGRIDSEVAPQRKGAAFTVETEDAIVSVVGTRFRVAAGPGDGTLVAVSEGKVSVRARRSGEVRLLGPGDEWGIEIPAAAAAAPAPLPEPVAEVEGAGEVKAAPAPGSARGPAVEAIAHQVRSQIQSGRIGAARSLIARTRAGAGGEPIVLAELAILEAEALLAERRYAQAIQAYLQTVERYRRTAQAEVALFAAAQLAADHPEAGFDGSALLRRYGAEYPGGQFADEARRALDDR